MALEKKPGSGQSKAGRPIPSKGMAMKKGGAVKGKGAAKKGFAFGKNG